MKTGTTPPYYRVAKLLALLLPLTYLVWVMFSNELPFDTGDGLLHYAISKKAFEDPSFLLNHWGKPLFILFSSSFAQFGFLPFTFFNLIVFTLTILLAYRIFEHFNVRGIVPLITPILLLSIPDYNGGIIGGLTEPFFGLLLVAMLWAALKEKWIVFALIASFTPFARSEGMLVLASAPVLLVVFKQWKALPVLLTGFVLYGILGQLLVGQPLWYFENDPYPADSPYGTGPWYDYIIHYESYLGKIAVILSPLMLLGLLMWRQTEPKRAFFIGGYFICIFLGIVVVHSYLWAYGLKGSGGLTRIATQGMPAALIIGLAGLGLVLQHLHKLTNAFLFILLSFFIVKRIYQQIFPIKASPFQKAIFDSGTYAAKNEANVGKIYYFHPLIAYQKGITSMEIHPKYVFSFLHLELDVATRFKTGDIIIRDAKFGPVEQGLSHDALAKYPWIKPVKHFYVNGNDLMYNGEPEMVAIYQIFPKSDSTKQTVFTKKKPLKLNNAHFTTSDEYFLLDEHFEIPALHGFRQALKINYSFNGKQESDIYLAFKDDKAMNIVASLDQLQGYAELYFATGNKKGTLFVYNPSKKKLNLSVTPDCWEEYSDVGVQKLIK